jgi:hypothetical protein
VLAAALLTVPFQGIAATLSVLICHGDSAAHTSHGQSHIHESNTSDGHTHEHQPSSSDDSGGGSMYHLCCNLSASVPVSIVIPAELPEPTLVALGPDSLNDLYDPDQPQRPPLA